MVLEDLPFVRVARVRAFEREGLGVHRVDDVDELGDGTIPHVRPLAIPPAQVQAHAVRRDTLQSIVDRGDVLRDELAVVREGLLGELRAVPGHGEFRTIELEEEAGLDDGPVLVLERVGDRIDVCLVCGIVVVGEIEPDLAGRYSGQEHLGRGDPLEGGQQGRDVLLDIGIAPPGDRAVARPETGTYRREGLIVLREQAGLNLGRQRTRGTVEARDAFGHVGGKGNLTHLTIVEYIDPDVGLFADHLGHRGLDLAREARVRPYFPLIVAFDHLHERRRPRQTAGVGGQDTRGTALHSLLLSRYAWTSSGAAPSANCSCLVSPPTSPTTSGRKPSVTRKRGVLQEKSSAERILCHGFIPHPTARDNWTTLNLQWQLP